MGFWVSSTWLHPLSLLSSNQQMHQVCSVIRASLPNSVSLPHRRLCACSNTTTCLPSTILAIHFTVGSPLSAPWESSGSVCGLIQSMLGENTHNIHHQQGTNPRKFPASLMTINSNDFPSVVPLSSERLLSDRDIINMRIHTFAKQLSDTQRTLLFPQD